MSKNNNQIFSEISNTLKIIAWRSLSNYYETKKDSIVHLQNSDVKKQIWDLCNGKNCQADIAQELEKDRTTIRDHLKPMLDGGILFTKIINNKNILISLDVLIQRIFESIDWI